MQTESKLRRLRHMLNACCLAVAVLLGSVFYYYGYLSQTRSGDQIEQQSDQLRTAFRKAKLVKVEYSRVSGELEEQRALLESRKLKLSKTPGFSEFIEQVSQIATDAGLEDVETGRGQTGSQIDHQTGMKVAELQAAFACQGDYRSICHFVDQLRTLPTHTRIRGLKISSEPGSGLCVLNIDFVLQFEANHRSAAEAG